VQYVKILDSNEECRSGGIGEELMMLSR